VTVLPAGATRTALATTLPTARLFMMRDPDGNHIAVVEAPPAE